MNAFPHQRNGIGLASHEVAKDGSELAVRDCVDPAQTDIGASEIGANAQGLENDGGRLHEPYGVIISPSDISLAATTSPTAGKDLAAMKSRFASDYASGLVGRYDNSFEHRARVRRKMAE